MNNEKLISIHLNSNKPDSFEEFILSLVKNTNSLELIEVIVSIDKDDFKMLNLIDKINNKYSGLIKKIETDLIKSFSDAWKPLNLLLNITSPSVKYISCMSDDIRFKTNNCVSNDSLSIPLFNPAWMRSCRKDPRMAFLRKFHQQYNMSCRRHPHTQSQSRSRCHNKTTTEA